ncbi:hypothetical protein GQ607_016443, partial [Colletotrichum asianum]
SKCGTPRQEAHHHQIRQLSDQLRDGRLRLLRCCREGMGHKMLRRAAKDQGMRLVIQRVSVCVYCSHSF